MQEGLGKQHVNVELARRGEVLDGPGTHHRMLVLGGGRREGGGGRREEGRGRVRGYVCVQYMQVPAYSCLGVRPRAGGVEETGNGRVCPSPG